MRGTVAKELRRAARRMANEHSAPVWAPEHYATTPRNPRTAHLGLCGKGIYRRLKSVFKRNGRLDV